MPEAFSSTLARLTDEQRDALVPYAAKAAWPSGFMVYQRGAPADGVFVVTHGRVVLRSRVRAGRSFVPGIATKNETFGSEGLQNGGRSGELREDLEEAHAWAIMGMNVFLGLRYAIWSEDQAAGQVADAANSILRDGIRCRHRD